MKFYNTLQKREKGSSAMRLEDRLRNNHSPTDGPSAQRENNPPMPPPPDVITRVPSHTSSKSRLIRVTLIQTN